MMMYGVSQQMVTAAGDWDLGTFLKNAFDTGGEWISNGSMIIGLICLGVAVYQIATGLMSHGKKQTNWFISILLLMFGGILIAPTGFEFVKNVSSGGRKTIEDLGGNAIYMIDYFKWTFLK